MAGRNTRVDRRLRLEQQVKVDPLPLQFDRPHHVLFALLHRGREEGAGFRAQRGIVQKFRHARRGENLWQFPHQIRVRKKYR